MSVEPEVYSFDNGRDAVGVDIELCRSLVARAGVREGRVIVSAGSTVAEAIETWADECGNHLRFALLNQDRLRSDIRAVRVLDGRDERITAACPVADGDVIRFRLRN